MDAGSSKPPWWVGGWKRVLLVSLGSVAVVGLAAGLTVWGKYKYLRAHADSILRDRVVASLSARFHSPVELDTLHLDVGAGVHVTGGGLRILYLAGPTVPDAKPAASPPMLSIDSFEFQTDFSELFKPTTRILTVYVRGMQLDIPPRRPRIAGQGDDPKRKSQPKVSIVVDKIVCTDSRIVIETSKPGKLPLVFNIANVTLTEVGTKKPLLYDAELTNPKPIGQVHATGTLRAVAGGTTLAELLSTELTRLPMPILDPSKGLPGYFRRQATLADRLARSPSRARRTCRTSGLT